MNDFWFNLYYNFRYMTLPRPVKCAPYVISHAKYYLIFKTTNYCWFKCPHCCENAGPENPKTYLPKEIIMDYLTQANQDKRFVKHVVFTGGEIFSSYKFGDKRYIPDLLTFAAQNDIISDIKTNAGWANTSFSAPIYQDLKDVAIKSKRHELDFPRIQISLSLDNFHTNCFDNNLKIAHELSTCPILVHVSSFIGQEKILDEFEKQLSEKTRLKNPIAFDNKLRRRNKSGIKFLGDKALYFSSHATLFNGGRAKDMKHAYKTPWPQFVFADSDKKLLVAFDNNGYVTLGENSGRKIKTTWRDENGKPKPLQQIMQELYLNSFEEIKYAVLHREAKFAR